MNYLGFLAVLAAVAFQANGIGNPGKYLVTMEKKELIEVITCVAKSKDPLLCAKFAACERLMAPRVHYALEECRNEVVPEGIKRCTPYSVVFDTPEIPEKIFDCVVKKVEMLAFPEKKIMLNFEHACYQKIASTMFDQKIASSIAPDEEG